MILKLTVILFTLFTVACQTHSGSRREPTSVNQLQPLVDYYTTQVELGQIQDQMIELKSTDPQIKTLQNKKEQIEQKTPEQMTAVISEVQTDQPLSVKIPFIKKWRTHHDELIIHELEPYALVDGKISKKMFLSTDTTQHFFLQLSNFVYSWSGPQNKNYRFQLDRDQAYLNAELRCTHDAIVYNWPQKVKALAGQVAKFKWYDKKLDGQRPVIELKDPQSQCEFTFTGLDSPQVYGIRLIPETQELARIGNPHLQSEICYMPENTSASNIEKYFMNPDMNYTTCPVKVDQFKTLEESKEGINAKVRILTGQNLSEDYIKKANPFSPLDFSQAPELDAILISYLVFRADFGGTTIMNALRYHAGKGTLIRIILSDVITLGKDRQMLLDFQSEFPNVKLLFYKYRPQGKGIKDWISSLHRTNHIKLFLTYSKSNSSANQVILGGRNIHDGFVFDQPSSNYIYPTVVNYSPSGDEGWARWEDFETLFTSEEIVKTIMGQFFSVLHADYKTVHFRSYTQNVKTKQALNPQYLRLNDNEVYIRSLVSIPFKDDHRLEKSFIQMIDSAEKLIKVSTPYFNLTEGLLEAFKRAADRGVSIELITRLDLDGDTADIVLSDVNKKSVNKLYDKIKVYEYTTKGKILHSKLFLIDEKFVMMGSVNLNLRSFYHDIENATLVYGSGFNQKINQIFENYKLESKLLTEKQKTTFWKRILISIIGTAL